MNFEKSSFIRMKEPVRRVQVYPGENVCESGGVSRDRKEFVEVK